MVPRRHEPLAREWDGIFSPSSGSSADTLGLLRVKGPPLTLFDLDTFAWLTERWREGEREPQGEVRFTLYQLGQDLYGHEPSGKDHQTMRTSLYRLQEALFELEGYGAEAARMGRLEEPSLAGGFDCFPIWRSRGAILAGDTWLTSARG